MSCMFRERLMSGKGIKLAIGLTGACSYMVCHAVLSCMLQLHGQLHRKFRTPLICMHAGWNENMCYMLYTVSMRPKKSCTARNM